MFLGGETIFLKCNLQIFIMDIGLLFGFVLVFFFGFFFSAVPWEIVACGIIVPERVQFPT